MGVKGKERKCREKGEEADRRGGKRRKRTVDGTKREKRKRKREGAKLYTNEGRGKHEVIRRERKRAWKEGKLGREVEERDNWREKER